MPKRGRAKPDAEPDAGPTEADAPPAASTRPRRRAATAAMAKLHENKDIEQEQLEAEQEEAEPPKKRGRGRGAARANQEAEAAAEAPAPSRGRKKKNTAPAPSAAVAAAGPAAPAEPTEPRVDRRGNRVSWIARPSQAILDRIDRALSVGAGAAHRLYLLDTQSVEAPGAPIGAQQSFTVLGASGNVYTVKIGCHPSCTCPDRIRGHVCKHILFCFLRVLGREPSDPLIWQNALTKSEADQVLSVMSQGGSITDMSALAEARVRQRYAAATGEQLNIAVPAAEAAAGGEGGAGPSKPGRPIEGDCPICYEPMEPTGEAVVTCNTCGNHAHTGCFGRWSNSKRTIGAQVTCVWCRSVWSNASAAANVEAAGAHVTSGGFGRTYINLADPNAPRPSNSQLYSNPWWDRS